jgi:hypothetical protein
MSKVIILSCTIFGSIYLLNKSLELLISNDRRSMIVDIINMSIITTTSLVIGMAIKKTCDIMNE